MARPARPIAAATGVTTQAASAADSQCAHHGALGTRPLGGNHRLGRTRDRKALLREAGRPSRPLGRIPWRVAAVCSPSASNPPTACAQDGAAAAFESLCSFGLHRVPRLAQQGDDLALAILPCVVEGRLAPLVLERRIRTSFEETLGDREAAVGYRVMQS